MSGEEMLKQIDPGTGLTLEELIDSFITSPREAKALKLYLTRDKKDLPTIRRKQNDPNNDI